MFGFNRPFVSRASRFGATHPNDPDYDGPEEQEQDEHKCPDCGAVGAPCTDAGWEHAHTYPCDCDDDDYRSE